mmetsp:Transcript_7901/g.26822  ORF Transcript_7901/g.26822 Transcript_7901/m.26822 type:complete len:276 (-) Transcript_7901:19-846(-)
MREPHNQTRHRAREGPHEEPEALGRAPNGLARGALAPSEARGPAEPLLRVRQVVEVHARGRVGEHRRGHAENDCEEERPHGAPGGGHLAGGLGEADFEEHREGHEGQDVVRERRGDDELPHRAVQETRLREHLERHAHGGRGQGHARGDARGPGGERRGERDEEGQARGEGQHRAQHGDPRGARAHDPEGVKVDVQARLKDEECDAHDPCEDKKVHKGDNVDSVGAKHRANEDLAHDGAQVHVMAGAPGGVEGHQEARDAEHRAKVRAGHRAVRG